MEIKIWLSKDIIGYVRIGQIDIKGCHKMALVSVIVN